VLDLVGWFTITAPSGPESIHLPIHRHLLRDYNDSALFLTFHPSLLQNGSTQTGKLPLTIYESVFEGDNAPLTTTDKSMEVDGEDEPQQLANLPLRFRELPYSVETGEAEMICVDFVARGGGNAMAVEAPGQSSAGDVTKESKKSRRMAESQEPASQEGEGDEDLTSALSPEDEDGKLLRYCSPGSRSLTTGADMKNQ
jgi:COP9 signalosome complex subunit 6